MKITDIRINPSNHAEYDVDYYSVLPSERNKILDYNNDVILYIEERLNAPSKTDFGGEYANFLDNIGISSNSEHGWWSIDAVRPENIDYFIKCWNNEDLMEKYILAKERIKKLTSRGMSLSNVSSVKELINIVNGL